MPPKGQRLLRSRSNGWRKKKKKRYHFYCRCYHFYIPTNVSDASFVESRSTVVGRVSLYASDLCFHTDNKVRKYNCIRITVVFADGMKSIVFNALQWKCHLRAETADDWFCQLLGLTYNMYVYRTIGEMLHFFFFFKYPSFNRQFRDENKH